MPNKALTVSIVIPVYNEEDYLAGCLDAIKEQIVRPLEVIVVDNNSTDKSLSIAKKYSFVKIFSQKTQGVHFARNAGFNAAKGDIIGRIDADTLIDANWVESLQKIFSESSLDAVAGPVGYHDMPLPKHNIKIDIFFRKRMYRHFERYPALFGSNMGIRRKAWRAVKDKVCMRRNIFEDVDLAIHLQKDGLSVRYHPQLRARTASRRLDDSLPAFYRYISLYKETYRSHGMNGLMPYMAIAIYVVFYLILWPIRRTYDPKIHKRNIFHLLHGNIPRKHPME